MLKVTNALNAEISGDVAIATAGSSSLTLNNAGWVVGTSSAIEAQGSGAVDITNSGTIGVGSVTGGAYILGGTGYALNLAAGGKVVNSGTISGGGAAILSSTALLTLTNTSTGVIRGGQVFGSDNQDAVFAKGGTLVNAGSITTTDRVGTLAEPTYSAIYWGTAGGTITNAAGGTLTGGTDALYGNAVQARGVTTFNNYGTATGGSAAGDGFRQFGDQASTINLHAGSVTGAIVTGAADDILAIYSGRGASGAATSGGSSGIILQNAGTLAAAVFGGADLGGGTNTLRLRGTGDGTIANGASGIYDLSDGSVIGASVLSKLDTGMWTLIGDGAAIGTINAGDGGGDDGLLILNGTGLTSAININGAVVRAMNAAALGTGAITMINPTLQFASTDTYGNAILLAATAPSTDPTRFQTFGTGITAILSGAITQATAGQPVVFSSVDANGVANAGKFLLTNTLNSWTGATTIAAGATLQGAGNTISGGSIANSGVLVFDQAAAGANAIGVSGSGTLTKAGAGALTLSGNNTYTGATIISAGQLIASGGSAVGDASAVTVMGGASLTLASNEAIGSLTGAGTVQLGTNRLTSGGDNTSTTFSGSIVGGGLGGGLTKTGAGVLTLSGANTYAGETLIQGGTLVANGTLDAATTVASAGTLSGAGTVNGAVTVANGGTLSGVQGNSLTMGSLNLSSGSIIDATFDSAGGPALFSVLGDLTLDGTVHVASTGAFGFGVYGLMTYGGSLTNNGLSVGMGPADAQQILVQTSVAGMINLVSAPTELLFWDGGNTSLHDNGAINGGAGVWSQASDNWTDVNGLANGAMEPQPGRVIFQGASGVVTVDNAAGPVSVLGMQFAVDGYRLEGGAITLADAYTPIRVGDGTVESAAWSATIASALTGAGGLVKTDFGTLILKGVNDYTGGTMVHAGTLALAGGAAINDATGVTVAAAGTLRLDSSEQIGSINGVGGVELGANTLTLGEGGSYAGVIGGQGNLVLAGGDLTLGGANTYTGATFVNAGTLTLGSSNVLADASSLSVAAGANFNMNGFSERFAGLSGAGDVNVGAGQLTIAGADSIFGGRVSGSGALVHAGGLFTLAGDHTISAIKNTGGELRFLGRTSGSLSVSGGVLTGGGTIGGMLTASNGGVISPGVDGVTGGIGHFTVGGLTLAGGQLNLDVTGVAAGSLIDQIRVLGTANLAGGVIAPTFHGPAGGFDFSTRYAFIQADRLVGVFANGDTFTAANQEGLFWRVRYDLAANAAVLELRQLTNFDPGAVGTSNQRAIGRALNGNQLGASDDYAAVLNLVDNLSAPERAAAFDSISGEAQSDITTSLLSANDHFMQAVQSLGGQSGDSARSLSFTNQLSLAAGRESTADHLAGVLNAYDPGASSNRTQGGWISVFTADQTLEGKAGSADVNTRVNGFAAGYGANHGNWTLGAAAGVSRLEGEVSARASSYDSDLAHWAGYVRYDDGQWAADVTASAYGGAADTRRTIAVGDFGGRAVGDTEAKGRAISLSVSRRFRFESEATVALGVMGTLARASIDGFTETGAGGLSIEVSDRDRDWQSLNFSTRAAQPYVVGGRVMKAYGGLGLLVTTGDRQAVGDMRFSGAPTGSGAFVVEGAETPPLAGVADVGVELEAADGIAISLGYRGVFSDRLSDNQFGAKMRVQW